MNRTRTFSALAAVLVAAGALTACDSGSDGVTQTELQDNMKTKMNEGHATKSPVSSVSCPRGLEPKEGDAVTCTATSEDGSKVEVDAKVTKIEDNTIHYSMVPKQSGTAQA